MPVRPTRSRLLALLITAAPLALTQPAQAAPLPPSLTPDTAYASGGIVKYDFATGVSNDSANGAAADPGLDRYYAVGEATTGGDSNVAIVARRLNGSLDPSFASDGTLSLPITTGKRDLGSAMVVLPDHRLRIVGATDVSSTATANLDIAVIGLLPDGAIDPSFGGGDGIATFPVGASDDTPTRMAIASDGRIAITGWTKTGSAEDTFAAVLAPDGTPLPGFGTAGVQVLNRGGAALNDRGMGIAWRPGGTGPVALIQVTAADSTRTAFLRAFTATGADDVAFDVDGDMAVDAGGTDTVPSGLIAYADRLWSTGTVKIGGDADAYVHRVNPDGSGPDSRHFDIRGTVFPDTQAVTTQGLDLTVVSGDPDTLVVGGSVTTDKGSEWAAAAFNDLGAGLAQLGMGQMVIPITGQGSIVGVAATSGNAVAATGSLLDYSLETGSGSFDSSIGMARLMVDADKRCDLAITIPSPLELVFRGGRSATAKLKIVNGGKRACGGDVSVPAPYVLTVDGRRGPIPTGLLAPGATRLMDAVLAYDGARPADDTLEVRATAAADTATGDNTASVHVLFSHCDAALSRIGGSGLIAASSTRRFEFTVANRGTNACRGVRIDVISGGTRVGRASPYMVSAGRSASDEIVVAVKRTPRTGRSMPLRFRVVATGDVQPANDGAGFSPKAVRKGADSNARRPTGGGRRFAGSSSPGQGTRKGRRGRLGVERVDVAILRSGGKSCRWVASAGGSLQTVQATKAGRRKVCDAPVWVPATGTRHWRLKLMRKLPKGSYTLITRAVLADDLAENAFSARDRNKIRFRVR